MIVYLNTTLNTGHAHGLAAETIILPVLARDEEPQPTTQESMFNYVRLSDGGPRRHEGPRSEVEVIARSLADAQRARTTAGADRLGSAVDWQACSTRRIREAIAEDRARLRGAGRDRRHEDGVSDRRPHASTTPRFPTPSGRARLARHELPRAARRQRQAAADDRPQRGAVQHGGLRGRRPVSRPGPPRRDPPASGRTSSGWVCGRTGA